MVREAASRRPVERAQERREGRERERERERERVSERERVRERESEGGRERERERFYADIRVSPVTAILRKTFDLFAHAE